MTYKYSRHLKYQNGETLIEIVLALAILSMVLFTTFNLVNNGTKVNDLARQRTQADNFVQQQAETLRNFRDNNSWSVFSCSHACGPIRGVLSFGGSFHMVQAGNRWVPAANAFTPTLNGRPTLYRIKITPTTVPSLPAGEHISFDIQASWAGPDGPETTNVITDLVKLEDFRPADCSAGCP